MTSASMTLAAVMALAAAGSASAAPHKPPPARASAGCDRACLDGFADRYIDAMVARAPGSLPRGRDRPLFRE